MGSERPGAYDVLSAGDLRAELKRLQENLQDLEETHLFTFSKTAVHLGAERAQSMQEEYEEECREYRARIAEIESILRTRKG